MTAPSLDQFRGAILGLALGDALGAVVEAASPADASCYVDAELLGGRAGTRGRGCHPFGQVTDDTQLARELLLSILDAGAFDPARFAERFCAFVDAGRLVGSGPASRSAARALAEGASWRESGIAAPYAGNGAAMRAGPLGLLYRDFATLRRVVTEQARVTHQDPRAAAGALAIAGAVTLAGRGDAVEPTEWLRELGRLVAPVSEEVATAVMGLAAWLPLEPAAAAAHVHGTRLEPAGDGKWLGISSFVTSSACWSLYAFLRHPDDWWAAVCTAIRVGGDTDTLGAMTGTIAGARVGAGVLPEPLLRQLHDGLHWRLDELERLARDCHRLTDTLR
jgi:ADP-ribosylglycohydrolase